MASPSFLLLGGRPAVTSAAANNGAAVTSLASRPAGSAARCRFARSNGGTNGGSGTQCSGNTGRSPRDQNVRAVEASTETSLLDDDSSAGPPENMIV